ncbi:MAG: hypothetical protein JRC99_10935 [Deltaproteobacteria bacterium]|nr:hypothetical protein [Deltaproteobacteria bacterium]
MQSRHSRGSTVRLFLDIIASGAGVIGESPMTAIQRKFDDKWFQVSDGTWVSTKVENPMSQTDSVNLPGRYHFDFDQSLDTLAGSTEYTVKKQTPSGTLALEYEDLVFGPLAGVVALELCSVQGTIFGPQGGAGLNSVVRATLIPVFKDGLGRVVESDRVVAAYANELGDFDLPLVRGGTFRLEIPAVGYDRKVVIPDQSSVVFSDL